MKAITITQESEPIQLVDIDRPEVVSDECLVKISAAALNRRDQWIREGMYPGIQFGTVLGSDGCGVVGEGPAEWKGKEVIINPNVEWGDNPEVQSSKYSVLGMPTNGTLAEYINVPAHRLHEKPAHLSDEEAAALPLAGLTAFRATIKKGDAKAGKRVLVTGAGGGVSQFAIAFAVSSGADVYVTSGSNDKIDRVKEFGVKGGFNYKDEKWFKEAGQLGGFDVIIDSAGGNQLNNYLKIVKPAGRIVMYGSTTGYPEKVDVFRLFWSQVQIMGSTMGSDEEFGEMLDWVNKHQIKPTVDKVFDVGDYLQAFDRFKEPDSFGKIVVTF
ncbi:zinc-binding alcohol dehydrogenase family protein [Ekhidna sp.]|uniref:quinone oxidoreductase family protein n=1 Tax=Ekhidna sp. TaxID=2608089 RepID=UPI0035173712